MNKQYTRLLLIFLFVTILSPIFAGMPRFTIWCNEKDIIWVEKIKQLYNKQRKGHGLYKMQIKLQDIVYDKFVQDSIIGYAPDIVLGDSTWIYKFAKNEIISPIYGKSGYINKALDGLKYKRKIYGLPVTIIINEDGKLVVRAFLISTQARRRKEIRFFKKILSEIECQQILNDAGFNPIHKRFIKRMLKNDKETLMYLDDITDRSYVTEYKEFDGMK